MIVDVDALAEAEFRRRMRGLARRGGEALKAAKAVADPNYFSRIGRRGGATTARAIRRRLAAKIAAGFELEPVPVAASGLPAPPVLPPGPVAPAPPVVLTPRVALSGTQDIAAKLSVEPRPAGAPPAMGAAPRLNDAPKPTAGSRPDREAPVPPTMLETLEALIARG